MSREAAWAFPSRATPNLSTQGPFGTVTGVRGLTHDEFHPILGRLRCFKHVFYFAALLRKRAPGQHGQRLCVLRDHPSKGACDIGVIGMILVYFVTLPIFVFTSDTWQHLACRNPSGSGSLVAKPPATTGWKSATHGSSVRRRGWRERWDPFWGLSPAQNMLGFVYTGFYSPNNCTCWDCCSPMFTQSIIPIILKLHMFISKD